MVGVLGDCWDAVGKAALERLAEAEVVAGGARMLRSFEAAAAGGLLGETEPGHGANGRRISLERGLDRLLDDLEDVDCPACVLASGDPGFFGIVRRLGERLGNERIEVHPGPSAVAVAFARLGLPWDDAVVVSAHGRPLGAATGAVRTALARGARAAVLCSPDQAPEAVAARVLDLAGDGIVCSRLGCADEMVARMSVAEVAAGRWDGFSVLVVEPPVPSAATMALHWETTGQWESTGSRSCGSDDPGRSAPAGRPALRRSGRFGLPESHFSHRAGMVTKAEIRAVVLSKLGAGPGSVVWDVGAGSGSVGIECAVLFPGCRVVAIERTPSGAAQIAANAEAHGVEVTVVCGEAPAVLGGLPAPASVFVGGGGPPVLEGVLAAVPPGTTVVAAYASLEHAAHGGTRLGSLTQLSADRGRQLPDGTWRLEGTNPVFVAWGVAPGIGTGGEARSA